MKKTSKTATKKPAQKKPVTKKPSAKTKRKAQGQSELAAVVARLDAIVDRLTEATGQLFEAAVRLSPTRESAQESKRENQALEGPGGVVGVAVVEGESE